MMRNFEELMLMEMKNSPFNKTTQCNIGQSKGSSAVNFLFLAGLILITIGGTYYYLSQNKMLNERPKRSED